MSNKQELCLDCKDIMANKNSTRCQLCEGIIEYNIGDKETSTRKQLIDSIKKRIEWYRGERSKCEAMVRATAKKIERLPDKYTKDTAECKREYVRGLNLYAKKIEKMMRILSAVRAGEPLNNETLCNSTSKK